MKRVQAIAVAASIFLAIPLLTTVQQPTVGSQTPYSGNNPTHKVAFNVVERRIATVHFRQREGSTRLDFVGTPLMPDARGEVIVQSKQGYLKVDAEFDDLQPPTQYGPELLTYVMWAINPEGRPTNLGELILSGPNGRKSGLDVTSDLQAFGLIVTAEPYFAVTQPSDVVVLENFLGRDSRDSVPFIDAKYELLKRGQYVAAVPSGEVKAIPLDTEIPLGLNEARNAVRIARWMGAEGFAAESYSQAVEFLRQAEMSHVEKRWKSASMLARQAVQTAEDARLMAAKHVADVRIAEERAAAERAEFEAGQAQLFRAQQALKDASAAARAAAEERTVRAGGTDAEHPRWGLSEPEVKKQQLPRALIVQLNAILQTRDSTRGLIVNMSDVVFETGQATLKPIAREKLAKISGILMAHPELKIEVEGHTDNSGSDEFNQALSENRALAVRDFLMQQGLDGSVITARGLGKRQPAASNDTSSGRSLNRRVEMVVSETSSSHQ